MKPTEENTMTHNQNEQCCDFCKTGRVMKSSLRIAFRQETDLGSVSCLADLPIGVCDRCGAKNWNKDAEAIAEETVRREYVKHLSMRRRQRNEDAEALAGHVVKLLSMRPAPAPYPLTALCSAGMA
jgi:hypothetical protein